MKHMLPGLASLAGPWVGVRIRGLSTYELGSLEAPAHLQLNSNSNIMAILKKILWKKG